MIFLLERIIWVLNLIILYVLHSKGFIKNRYFFIFLNTQQSYPPHQAIQFKWPIQYMYSSSLLSGISLISKWASTIPNRTSFLKFSSFLPHANYRYFTTKWVAKREREIDVNERNDKVTITINNDNNNNNNTIDSFNRSKVAI